MKKGRIFSIICYTLGVLAIAGALTITFINLNETKAAEDATNHILGELTSLIGGGAGADAVPGDRGDTHSGVEKDAETTAQPGKDTEPGGEQPVTGEEPGEPGPGGDPDGPGGDDPYADIASPVPDYVLEENIEMPTVKIDGVRYCGIITIPRIDRQLPVAATWDYTTLKQTPCRYAGSAYKDNFVICGHNYIVHLGPIRRLKYGDDVIFTDVDGNVFKYKVVSVEILPPDASVEMKTSGYALSLFTCTLGGQTRVTVRCDRA